MTWLLAVIADCPFLAIIIIVSHFFGSITMDFGEALSFSLAINVLALGAARSPTYENLGQLGTCTFVLYKVTLANGLLETGWTSIQVLVQNHIVISSEIYVVEWVYEFVD